jgi:TRAP-type C4-dicarboxylate transport system permease large subunit
MAAALGIDPVHFAIVVIVNLTMGMITPPVGGLLFVTALVARIPVSGVIRELWPMMGVLLVVLAILTLVPEVSLFLPRLLLGP